VGTEMGTFPREPLRCSSLRASPALGSVRLAGIHSMVRASIVAQVNDAAPLRGSDIVLAVVVAIAVMAVVMAGVGVYRLANTRRRRREAPGRFERRYRPTRVNGGDQ
jgi:hypothetical protein